MQSTESQQQQYLVKQNVHDTTEQLHWQQVVQSPPASTVALVAYSMENNRDASHRSVSSI